MTQLKAAFFVKNVPSWERVLRVAVALAVALVSLNLLEAAWGWSMATAAVGFGLTGLVGFCPACALVGRQLPERE
jgi:hypothetical protein